MTTSSSDQLMSDRISMSISPISVSVILPVMDETVSLKETIRILLEENSRAISEIIIVVCKRTTPESIAVCETLQREQPDLVKILWQKLPFLGGAIRDCFDSATGSHVLMMASDLETDPRTVKDLITTAEQGFDIVTATRWTQKDAFHGYDPLKYRLNWVFQQIIRVLYGTRPVRLDSCLQDFQDVVGQEHSLGGIKTPFSLGDNSEAHAPGGHSRRSSHRLAGPRGRRIS